MLVPAVEPIVFSVWDFCAKLPSFCIEIVNIGRESRNLLRFRLRANGQPTKETRQLRFETRQELTTPKVGTTLLSARQARN